VQIRRQYNYDIKNIMIDELGINCVILAQIMLLVADSAKMSTSKRS